MFNSLANLENLYLDSNEITNIPNGLFDNLISLKLLGLIFNKINLKRMSLCKNKIEFQEDIDPNIFKSLRKLTCLHLYNNQISILPEEIFKNLLSLKELDLANNHIMSY